MEYSLDWLYQPEVYEVNRQRAHSDHDFFTPEGSLRQSLNGTWKFSYAENPESRRTDLCRTDTPIDDLSDITVPGHIQLQGWDRCQYVNNMYPWDGHEQAVPPQVPRKHNPVGTYVRLFTLDSALRNKRCFISFQGVENAFFLWLNGHFVGYSEDSFTPAEFDITEFLTEGENRLVAEVYKYSTASWLEDQDFWRFSGIFRDVFLYAIPEVHVSDMKIFTGYDHLTGGGTIESELVIFGRSPSDIRLKLTDADGNVMFENTSSVLPRCYNFTELEKVHPWSAEDPYLYTFTAEIVDKNGNVTETACTKVGFRTFKLIDGIMCLNGRRIIFKGVDRHEFSAYNGRVVSESEMLYDIILMKQNNINAVRTSHYPNSTQWYRLCDEYGIYLIDEANLETHGAWLQVPNSLPEWKDAVVDRAMSMFERDKNHPSILIWSCGNESYCDDNIARMAELLHYFDSTRLVHYEGVFHNRAYDHITDMESRMYARPHEIEEYLQQNTGKPYISCEYMHAMGNSLGGMSLYTDLEDKYPGYQGGFIWDYIDQALFVADETGMRLAYGGDFDDRSTDYGFCTNGLVYADRTPSPKLQEAKALYSNIKMKLENGTLTVENRNLFTDTANLIFTASEQPADGRETAVGSYTLNIAPGESGTIADIPFTSGQPGEYIRTVSAALAHELSWAPAGHEIAFAQETVKTDIPCAVCERGQTEIVYSDFSVGVHGDGFSMLFDKKECGISSLVYNGTEYITRAPKVSFWRAPTDNDTGAGYPYEMAQWKIAGGCAKYIADKFRSEEKSDRIDIFYEFAAPTVPSFNYTVIYSAYYDGRLGVRAEYPGVEGLPDMPVFAIDFKLKNSLDRFEFCGRGPCENYCDRFHGAKLGVYRSYVRDNLSGYLNPQECGNRTAVRYLSVFGQSGAGLRFDHTGTPFEMSVLPCSAYELENASHISELPDHNYTWVRIAAKQMGVGGDDSWGAPVHDEFKIPAKEPLSVEFTISPCVAEGEFSCTEIFFPQLPTPKYADKPGYAEMFAMGKFDSIMDDIDLDELDFDDSED